MGAKGAQTTTQNQNQTYTPVGQGYMQTALNQAQGAAQLPFSIPQAPVAGFSDMQQQGFQGIQNAQGAANPYYSQAQQYYSPQGAQQFFNPFADAVTAQMQNIFGQQQAQNTGNLVQSAGGVGADRIAVGQGNLANQQGLAAGQTYANMYSQAQQQAQQAGQNFQNLGTQVQGNAYQGANALLGAGGLQQQLAQQQMNAPYQQQVAQAAFPYQQAQFLAGITGALAPGLGGTTTGQSQSESQYNPSLWGQIGGAALGIGSLFMNRGGGISNPFAAGGGVPSSPIDISQGYIPQTKLAAGSAHMPNLNFSGGAKDMTPKALDFGALGKMAGSLMGPAYGGGNIFTDAYGGSGANPLPGLSASDYGPGFAPGGSVRNPFAMYADGGGAGEASDEDRAWGTNLLRSAMAAKFGANAGDPIRLPDQGAVEQWRQGVDADAPDAMALSGPTTAAPSRAIASAAPAMAPAAGADDLRQPSQFAPAAAPAAGGNGSGFGDAIRAYMHDPAKMAMLMAGLNSMRTGSLAEGIGSGTKYLQQAHESDLQDLGVEQAAQKLQQEAQQHLDAMNKPVPIGDKVYGQLDRSTGKYTPIEGGKAEDTTVTDIVDGMARGDLPPTTQGLYGKGAAVRAEAARRGLNLTQMGLQYSGAQKQVSVLNGPQTVRLMGLAKSVDNTIDEVTALGEQLHNSGIPVLNHAKLVALMQTEGNSPRGQLATKYMTAVNTVREEFANAANGGYAPTEPAWKLANEQINGDYGEQQLKASLGEVQRLIRYRINAIPNIGTLGPTAPNRYTGQQAAPQGGGGGFTGRTATNKSTGQRLRETSDGQWVP